MVTAKGYSKFPADVKGFNTDSIKREYWYQAAKLNRRHIQYSGYSRWAIPLE